MKQVFLSCSSADSEIARRIETDLRARGVKVWYWESDMKVGHSIVSEISQAIKETDFLLVLLSEQSTRSEWVNREINAALVRELAEHRVVVLPARLDRCPVPSLLADKVYADFRPSYEFGLVALLDAISHHGAASKSSASGAERSVDDRLFRDRPFEQSWLPNGLRIIVAPMPHAKSASISVFVGAGPQYEMAKEAGISLLTMHICFDGSQHYPTSKHIAATAQELGGQLNAGVDKELSVFWSKLGGEQWETGLKLLIDMIHWPLLEPGFLEHERMVVMEERNAIERDLSSLTDILLDNLMWGSQSLGRDALGTRTSVSRITIGQVRHYHSRQYVPNNTLICVAGNVSHADVVSEVWEAARDWKEGRPNVWLEPGVEQKRPRCSVEHRDSDNIHIGVGLPGFDLLHPDRFTLDLLNVVLGEAGASSRLHGAFRNRLHGYFKVHSSVEHYRNAGSLVMDAEVEPSEAERAVRAILDELSAVMRSGVSDKELDMAKRIARGRLLIRMDDTRNVTGWYGAQGVLTGNVRTLEEVLSGVDVITRFDIQRVAQQLFIPQKLNLVVVGPASDKKRFRDLLA